MKSWDLDPVKRDYILDKGSPVQTDSLRIPAYIRIKAKRRQWMYAPNDQWGSDLYLIQRRSTVNDTNLVENTAARALQPIVDDGRATEADVTTLATARHGVSLEAKIITANGDIDTVSLPGLGV